MLRDGLFKQAKYKIPNVRVSVGFPGGRGGKKAIGQHWHPNASDDGRSQIFIHPSISDSIECLDVLVHELCHACTIGAKHGPIFKKCALAVGLEGQMRSASAGAILKEKLKALHTILGDYPHSKLNLALNPVKKQTTRMIKMTCTDCGYIVRASTTAIVTHGAVICPCNDEAMQCEV